MYSKLLALAMAGLALQGCSTVPVASLPKLARIDFMTTDLSRLRVAVALPLALAPKPGGVLMQMKYQVGQEPEKQETLHLIPSPKPSDRQGLPLDGSAPQAVYVMELAPADVQRLNALRSSVAAAKTRHEKGSLGFGIETREFCTLSALPAGPALTSTFVLTSETEGYVTLLRDFDLRSQPEVAQGLAKLEACS